MNLKIKKILNAALELSPRQRQELVTELVMSLEEARKDDPDEVQKTWAREIERRIKEIDDGKVVTIPWETVRDELRVKLHGKNGKISSSRKKGGNDRTGLVRGKSVASR